VRLERQLVQSKNMDFEILALPHLDSAYRTALALCRDGDEAADLVQTAFLKALEKFGTFRPGTSVKAWLLQILRNEWIDRLRRRRVIKFTPATSEMQLPARSDSGGQCEAQPPANTEDAKAAEGPLLESFGDEHVLAALRKLPGDQRLAILLVDVEGMSLLEVAQVLDVAEGTIKSRTSRARAAMRDELRGHAKDMGFIKRDHAPE
jgi:RNA polymerase sigma-70 factor, ECF subfamily